MPVLNSWLLLLLAALLVSSNCQEEPPLAGEGAGAAPEEPGDVGANGGSPFEAEAPQGAFDDTRPGQFGVAPALGAPGEEPRLEFQGTGTVAYAQESLGPFDAAELGCSLGFLSPTFQSNYVGVSPQYFQNAQACGRCIILQCDDQSCAEPGEQLPALVADVCGSCTGADLSISTPLFVNLTGREPGPNPSIVVSWDLVSCSSYIEGTIKMLLKRGGSAFYQAFAFSNYLQPIVAVQVNGARLRRGSDNFWAWNPGQPITPAQPLDVALLGANGEVLRARVPSLRSADLGVQFEAS